MTELHDSLVALGRYLDARQGAFGARKKSDRDAAALSLTWLREQICPKREELMSKVKTSHVELGMAIFDIVLFSIGNSIPGVLVITKTIAHLGLERFCAEPDRQWFS